MIFLTNISASCLRSRIPGSHSPISREPSVAAVAVVELVDGARHWIEDRRAARDCQPQHDKARSSLCKIAVALHMCQEETMIKFKFLALVTQEAVCIPP